MQIGAESAYTVASPFRRASRETFLEEFHLSSSAVETKVNRNSPDFEKNTRRMVDLLTEIKNQETAIQQGGGAKAIEAQHKKSRLTARERISQLIDPGSQLFELGLYAGYEMYAEWGGAPAASGSLRVQVSDARVQVQFGPLMAVAVSGVGDPAGNVSVTVTVPMVGPVPTLLIVMV